jgi:hypothetical protein
MRRLGRALLWLVGVLGVVVLALLAPVAWVELACRGEPVASDYTPLLPPENRRVESRTLLTYPEWHIVHAYDDYARVIATGDPHDFGFFRAVRTYWSSLCALTEQAAAHGGVDGETRQMVYVIGVSFTAELTLKAAYEETLGRLFVALRGPERAPLDDLSARQAADYAAFLQQVPWYKWDFRRDIAELEAAKTNSLRDRERRFALGTEYAAKAGYAGVIASAVASVGADELTLRMIVTGAAPEELEATEGITLIAERPEGIEIETPRYRKLTNLLIDMAGQGVETVEIAGNDDIMLTVLSDQPTMEGSLFSFPRQGYGDWRHLLLVKVPELMPTLRRLAEGTARVEHVHDY